MLRLALLLIALLLAYSLTLAACNGLADIYARPAKNYLQDKRDEGGELSEPEEQAIEANLRRALELTPDDPAILTELGRLRRVQMDVEELEREEFERLGESAIDYYDRAARFRPTWPWGWSSLAELRYELYQDTQDSYHRALINAASYGPWEAQVQRRVTELGLDSWESLSKGAQQSVLGMIDRGLKRQAAGIEAIIEPDEGWRVLCLERLPEAESGKNPVTLHNIARLQERCTKLSEQPAP